MARAFQRIFTCKVWLDTAEKEPCKNCNFLTFLTPEFWLFRSNRVRIKASQISGRRALPTVALLRRGLGAGRGARRAGGPVGRPLRWI